MKKIWKAFLWFVRNIEEIVSVTAIAVMLLSCVYNVIMRYVFRNPISGTDEISIIGLGWTTFVGSAAAYKRNLHLGMEFFIDRLPRKGKLAMKFVTNLMLVFLFGYLTYISFTFTVSSVKLMNFTRLPYRYLDASAIFGFASMTLYSAIYLIQGFAAPERFAARYLNEDWDDDGSLAADQTSYPEKGENSI